MKVDRIYMNLRTLAALLLVACGAAAQAAAGDSPESIARLVGERGCTVCHREVSVFGPDSATPLAPSWREIALRYRYDPLAGHRLARIVIDGANPRQRHWRDRLDFATMDSNARRVQPAEARAIVHWILTAH